MKCKKCSYEWNQRTTEPKACPRCKARQDSKQWGYTMEKVFRKANGGYTKINLTRKDWLLIERFMRDNNFPIGNGHNLLLAAFLDFYKKQAKASKGSQGKQWGHMASNLNGISAALCFIACVVIGVSGIAAYPLSMAAMAVLLVLSAWNFYIWGMWQQELQMRESSINDYVCTNCKARFQTYDLAVSHFRKERHKGHEWGGIQHLPPRSSKRNKGK